MHRYWSPLAAAVGGVIGSLLRWGFLSLPSPDQAAVATFGLNLAGSLFLGVLVAQRHRLSNAQFHLLGTGFAGGLTTFSTFAVSVATQLEEGELLAAASNSIGTLFTVLVAAGLGYRVGKLSN